ncbi:hypothetical protein A2363_00350 [Candidatus Gottesmanbacteria bacterium RIFOXYB1_FULL_47_11]|uniref:Uncharacterized protein n=1 Tax=Candidatus Gottesmanbacteria bacterium RIFOXYB1_FULL_47_11 TaxID=1798401 RepID=A0A1F6BD71_9BACT|nr:MAG: hypothetical protein A2363_00350 [Candidatus Gottesmanbacteria bacterium RIFOXYB1_FULL_47_11]
MPDNISPIRASTQQFTEVEDIAQDMALFTDGSCAMIISVAAVNFGLLSEKEQDAIIYAYAGLLNSLSFPIQVLIRTQHKDVTAYLKTLEDGEKNQKNPKLAANMHSYRLFVAATVKEKDVLDKKFYITIPFSYLELGTSASLLLGGGKKGLPFPKSYIFERALAVLTPKKDHILRLLARIGLQAKQLTGEQIARLLFEIYNQGAPTITAEDLQKAMHT